MDAEAPITAVEVTFAAIGHHMRVRFDLLADVIQGTGQRPNMAWDGQILLSAPRREALLVLVEGLVPAMQARLQDQGVRMSNSGSTVLLKACHARR